MRRAALFAVLTLAALPRDARAADDALPPWTDATDVPLPPWTQSVVPNRAEAAVYTEPGRLDLRRGSAGPNARLPIFATRRGPGCGARWLNVGPLAWICSDVGDFRPDAPASIAVSRALPSVDPTSATDDGLPHRYYFAGRDGAYGFADLATALDDAPVQELEQGFAVAIVEEKHAHGERWGKTKKGHWIAMRELAPVRPNVFHGELVTSGLDVAWVVADKANVYASEKATDKSTGVRVRFEKVHAFEEKGTSVRISAEGEPAAWMRARDLARAKLAAPPPEIPSDVDERWIDVDLAQQTLVAYAGKRPVFATIVSTGKGAPGSEFATHPGTFRIWAKLFTTKMDNLDKEEAEKHYAIEDVPWVQFFDKAIAIHGAFWHRDFGRTHSHGCVNMAPLDARWVFAFTAPTLPVGWTAVLPTKIEQGAVVRVH